MPDPATHCKGKIRYVEFRTAEKHRLLTERFPSDKEGVLETCRCKICGFWHVGHNRMAAWKR